MPSTVATNQVNQPTSHPALLKEENCNYSSCCCCCCSLISAPVKSREVLEAISTRSNTQPGKEILSPNYQNGLHSSWVGSKCELSHRKIEICRVNLSSDCETCPLLSSWLNRDDRKIILKKQANTFASPTPKRCHPHLMSWSISFPSLCHDATT